MLVDNGKYLRLNEEELVEKVQTKGARFATGIHCKIERERAKKVSQSMNYYHSTHYFGRLPVNTAG